MQVLARGGAATDCQIVPIFVQFFTLFSDCLYICLILLTFVRSTFFYTLSDLYTFSDCAGASWGDAPTKSCFYYPLQI